jgi:hypothetical protein
MVSPDDFGVLIAADALAATARGNWPSLARQWALKAYAFTATDRLPSDRQRLRVEGVFGPPLVPAHDRRLVAAHLAIVPWVPAAPGGAGLERKRARLWGCAVRNRHVATLAAAVRAGDESALVGLGMARLANDLAGFLPEGPRVAVLVEGPEHGRTLVALLPGWRLVGHESRPRRGGWGGYDPAAPLRDPARFDMCVVTTLAARRIESLDVDVLVRADGAGSPLRLPGFPAPDRESDRAQALVDFADDFDDAAAGDTRSRLRAYRDAGWRIDAAPPWAAAD